MIEQIKWADRNFTFDLQPGIFPLLITRFTGTPARIEELTGRLSSDILRTKLGGKWSIKEEAGHLLYAEKINAVRFEDFKSAQPALTGAFPQTADDDFLFSAKSFEDVLKDLRAQRLSLCKKLEELTEEDISISKLHPRLNKQMRIIDWLYFMCEHDDHHLTKIRLIKEKLNNGQA